MKNLILLLAALTIVPMIVIAGSSYYGCDSCHVPHHAGTEDIGMPLWNPERDVDMSHLTPYSSDTLDAAPGTPDGISKLCLSCHDGTGSHSDPGTGGNFNNDISNMHPVSFVYDSALATDDGELNDPSNTYTPAGDTIEKDMLIKGKMQCSSCHDPHVQAEVSKGLLRIANETGPGGSQLCRTCHIK
ncbi:MAG: cytochrome C [Phycisphaerae bacterium]|nr:cytochrome C [Phycisphaerae bacterium]